MLSPKSKLLNGKGDSPEVNLENEFNVILNQVKPERIDEVKMKLQRWYKDKENYNKSSKEFSEYIKSYPIVQSSSEVKGSIIFSCPYIFNIPYMDQQFTTKILLLQTRLSSVYIVTHKYDNQIYAVKQSIRDAKDVMASEALCSNSVELWNEIRILSNIKHPNIIQYYFSWIEKNYFFLQVEYLQCGSVYDYLYNLFEPGVDYHSAGTSIRAMSEIFIEIMIAHIGSALVVLEEQFEQFHNDVKPSNILIGVLGPKTKQNAMTRETCYKNLKTGNLEHRFVFKLSDFGRSDKYEPNMDLEGVSDGDGRYLANFQCMADESEIKMYLLRKDVFALGVTVFECFGHSITIEVGRDIRNAKKCVNYSKNLDGYWKDLIKRMCDCDSSKRVSARELIENDKFRKHVLPQALRLINDNSRTESNSSAF